MGGQSHHNTARIPALCHKLQSHTNKMIIPISSSSDFLSLIFPSHTHPTLGLKQMLDYFFVTSIPTMPNIPYSEEIMVIGAT